MARRLVEQGVTYVEFGVALGGWDTHTNNDAAPPRAGQGDVVADRRPGLVPPSNTTTIVWMGEFGVRGSTRTPVGTTGRGAGRSWWVVRLEDGQAIGATDKDGVDIVDRPVGVMDLVATMTKAMGLNIEQQYTTPRGRPIGRSFDAASPSRNCLVEFSVFQFSGGSGS